MGKALLPPQGPRAAVPMRRVLCDQHQRYAQESRDARQADQTEGRRVHGRQVRHRSIRRVRRENTNSHSASRSDRPMSSRTTWSSALAMPAVMTH